MADRHTGTRCLRCAPERRTGLPVALEPDPGIEPGEAPHRRPGGGRAGRCRPSPGWVGYTVAMNRAFGFDSTGTASASAVVMTWAGVTCAWA